MGRPNGRPRFAVTLDMDALDALPDGLRDSSPSVAVRNVLATVTPEQVLQVLPNYAKHTLGEEACAEITRVLDGAGLGDASPRERSQIVQALVRAAAKAM